MGNNLYIRGLKDLPTFRIVQVYHISFDKNIRVATNSKKERNKDGRSKKNVQSRNFRKERNM